MASRRDTTRSISSLDQLKPGDHIKVSAGIILEHHMVVVAVVSDSTIRVIHKTNERNAVVEEDLTYKPEEITVLDYECAYTGQKAIDRARARIGEDYNLLSSNCEHFVYEVRTGAAKSDQVQNGVTIGGLLLGITATVATGVGVYYGLSRPSKKDK